MKYKLSNNVLIERSETETILKKQIDKSKISLQGFSATLLDLLLSQSDKECVERIMEQGNIGEVEARKVFNTLLYPLYKVGFVVPVTKNVCGGVDVNISSTAIELTNACNFRCPHCYVEKDKTTTLTKESVKKILDELVCLQANPILLTGGEVLLLPYFKEIYEYAYTLGFIVSINTNGSLISDEIIDLFNKMPPYAVQISVYGYNEESYCDFTKCSNNFEKVVGALKKLKENSITVSCKNVVTNSNISYFEKIQELCESLDVPFRMDYISFPQKGKVKHTNPEQISPKNAVKFALKDPLIHKKFLDAFDSDSLPHKYVFECRRDDDGIFISSDGLVNICPCMQLKEIKVADGLLSAVKNLKTLGNMEFEKHSKCKNCKYMPVCRYCPAKFYMTTGSYLKPPKWFCEYGRLVYKHFVKGIRFISGGVTAVNLKTILTGEEIEKFGSIEKVLKTINDLEKTTPIKVYKNGKLKDICLLREDGKMEYLVDAFSGLTLKRINNKIKNRFSKTN